MAAMIVGSTASFRYQSEPNESGAAATVADHRVTVPVT
jgi:hypothetical protein